MWIVAKVKKNNSEIFKEEFKKKIKTNIMFYEPKYIFSTYVKGKKILKKKLLLENYVFCEHDNFSKIDIKHLQFIKGLSFFLDGHLFSQNSIREFINKCKSYEDDNGNVRSLFFKKIVSTRGKFISGPFKNIIFEIIKKNKNNLVISFDNIVTTVSDKIDCIYRPV
jgi:hypothetical protein